MINQAIKNKLRAAGYVPSKKALIHYLYDLNLLPTKSNWHSVNVGAAMRLPIKELQKLIGA